MKRISVCVSFLLCCILLVSQANAQFNKAGRTAFQFIKIGVGARQSAMGDASVAYVRDANAIFWNPANITGVQSAEGSFSWAKWFADMNYISGAAAVRWEGIGVFGVGLASLKYGNIDEALAVGAKSDTRTGNSFTGSDMMIAASFSREFTDALSIGVTAKILQEKLFVYSTSVASFDIGSYYNTGFKGIKLGMSFQNFGKSVKFLSVGDRDEGYDIPLIFRVGVAMDLIAAGGGGMIDLGADHRLALTGESVNSNDYGDRWEIGGEYCFDNFLYLRGGYRLNFDEGNLSLGIGLQQKLADMNVRLDYSYTSFKYLESPHRLTLSVSF